AGEARLQFDNRLADGGGIDFNQLLVVGQLAEWRWDSYFFWHNKNWIIGSLEKWIDGRPALIQRSTYPTIQLGFHAFTLPSCASRASNSRRLGLISRGLPR